jgi:hypothetical protein
MEANICSTKPYAEFFHQGGSKAYMPKKVPNIQRIINNDILKMVNIVFSGGGGGQLPPLLLRCVRPRFLLLIAIFIYYGNRIDAWPFIFNRKYLYIGKLLVVCRPYDQ